MHLGGVKMYTNQNLERRLFVKPYDRMVGDVVDEINNNNIILDPDYQRNYVWNNIKASLLIESILLNIPIPVIYASEDENGKWIIVDGLQRLFSLKRFFANDFKLGGLETLSALNGKKFANLDPEIQIKIKRGELRFIVLQNDSDPNIQFDIFMRLNTGAVKLNQQELRNCLYRGNLNEMVKNYVSNDACAKMLIKNSPIRMFGNELVFRYLAISENFNKESLTIQNYDGRIKNIINLYMKKNQNVEGDILESIKSKIETSFKKALEIFGDRAFLVNEASTKVNASLAESMMIALEDYDLGMLINKKAELNEGKRNLLANPDFLYCIDKATGNTANVNKRIKMFIDMVRKVMCNDL